MDVHSMVFGSAGSRMRLLGLRSQLHHFPAVVLGKLLNLNHGFPILKIRITAPTLWGWCEASMSFIQWETFRIILEHSKNSTPLQQENDC